MQHAADHLNAVARQPNDTLDVIGRIIARELEYRDVATLRLGTENAAVEQVRAPGERIFAVAVAEFRDKQIVAHEQSGDHRAGRDIEGLIEKNPHQKRKDQRMHNDPKRVHQAAALRGFFFDISFAAHPIPSWSQKLRHSPGVLEHSLGSGISTLVSLARINFTELRHLAPVRIDVLAP